MSDTPRTDALHFGYKGNIDMQRHELLKLSRTLERKLVAAQAEIVRLKGEAESWEKVFDRTCEHLADAKTKLAAMKKGEK
jgi:DNA primase large subunit